MAFIISEAEIIKKKDRIIADFDLKEVFYANVNGRLYIIKRAVKND